MSLLATGLIACSQQAESTAEGGNVTVGSDGARYIEHGVFPPSIVMSEDARNQLLPRTESRGSAPPSAAPMSMAERRERMTEDLQRRGYQTVFSTTNGIHGWPWFRRYVAEFAQEAFQ